MHFIRGPLGLWALHLFKVTTIDQRLRDTLIKVLLDLSRDVLVFYAAALQLLSHFMLKLDKLLTLPRRLLYIFSAFSAIAAYPASVCVYP